MPVLKDGRSYWIRMVNGELKATELDRNDREKFLSDKDPTIPSIWDIQETGPTHKSLDGIDIPKNGIFVTKTPEGLMKYSVKKRPVVLKVEIGDNGTLQQRLLEHDDRGEIIFDPKGALSRRIVAQTNLDPPTLITPDDIRRKGTLYLAKSESGGVLELETVVSPNEIENARKMFFNFIRDTSIQLRVVKFSIHGRSDIGDNIIISRGRHGCGSIVVYSSPIMKDKDIEALDGVRRMASSKSPDEMDKIIDGMTTEEKNAALDILKYMTCLTENRRYIQYDRAVAYHIQKIRRTPTNP